ncbi:MAG: cytochrome c4 [Sulfurifustaceae bacterium]
MPSRFVLPLLVVGLLFSAVCSAQATGNAANGKAKAGVCAGCHGADGNGGADPSWPKLAGQVPEYLVTQLKAFKSGARKNPIMSGMAAPLADQDMNDLATYFASLNVKPGAAGNKDLALAGEQLYRGGNAQNGVPACMSCHGPAGHGIPPRFPQVTSQNAAYTERQLLDFKARRRVDNGAVMAGVAGGLADNEIKAVSEYMAGLH